MSDSPTSHPATPSSLGSKSTRSVDYSNNCSQAAVTFRFDPPEHGIVNRTTKSKESDNETKQDESTVRLSSITEPLIESADYSDTSFQSSLETPRVAVSGSSAKPTSSPAVKPTKRILFWKSQRSKSLTRDTSLDVSDSDLSLDSDRQSRVTKSPRRKSTGTGMKITVSGKIALLARIFTRTKSDTGISNKLKSCSLPNYQPGSIEVLLSQPPQQLSKNENSSMLTPADAAEFAYRPRQTLCAKRSRSLSEIREVPPNSRSISSSSELSANFKFEKTETSFEQSVIPIEQSYYDNNDNGARICRPFPLELPNSRLPGDSLLKEGGDSLIDAADAFTFGVRENSSYDRAVEDAARETPVRTANQPLLYESSTAAHRPLRATASNASTDGEVFTTRGRSDSPVTTRGRSGSQAGSPAEDRISLCSTNTTASTASNKKKGVGGFIRRARSIGKSDRKRSPGGVANKSMGAALSADPNGMATDSSQLNLPLITVGQSTEANDSCNSAASTPLLSSYRKISMQPQPLTPSQAQEDGIAQLPATPTGQALPATPTGAALPVTPTNNPGILGRLKRSMSLTRINKRRPKRRLSEGVTNTQSKLRGARSTENLSQINARVPSVDLGDSDAQISAVHQSLLGEDNCIEIRSCSSSTFYSCRNSQERSQWMHHLKRAVTPAAEQSRRTEVSLKLFIQECKNCAATKRLYFCEVCLDGSVFARTSSKVKQQLLFWGEQFNFESLPEGLQTLTVSLVKEADRRKRKEKNVTVGVVRISLSDLPNRKEAEKWYPVELDSSTKATKELKSEPPQIRIKLKYQSVDILPLSSYSKLLRFIKENYHSLVNELEPLLSVKTKDDVATSLVYILQREQIARRFLTDIIMSDVSKTHKDNSTLLLRGNSISTKAVESYMKLIGDKYLQETLGDFIKHVLDTEDSCEVDPSKLGSNSSQQLKKNQSVLIEFCEMVWGRIVNTFHSFPSELREVFASFRRQCDHLNQNDISDNLISASIFLRFICPAIMSPSLFNLCQELPEERASRSLTLVAKTLQSLANLTKFGVKENYMTFLNEFVDREWSQMKNFLIQISSAEPSYRLPVFEGHIDSGKHLSVLHSLLVENLPKPSNERAEVFNNIEPLIQDISAEMRNEISPNSSQSSVTMSKQTQSSLETSGSLSTLTKQNSTPHTLFVQPTRRTLRPESDEYVELTRDMMSKHAVEQSETTGPATAARQLTSNTETQRSTQQTTLAVLPTQGNGADQALFDDPTLRSIHSGVLTTSASLSSNSTGVSTSSAGLRKVIRHRVWDRALNNNQLINGDYIDLISYTDPEITPPESRSPVSSTHPVSAAATPLEGQSIWPPTEMSEQEMRAIVSNVKQQLDCNSLRKGATSQHKEPPVAFINPAFKFSSQSLHSMNYTPSQSQPSIAPPSQSQTSLHQLNQSAASYIQGLRDSDSPSQKPVEFTPLPNKQLSLLRFNSLNIRGSKPRPLAVVDAQRDRRDNVNIETPRPHREIERHRDRRPSLNQISQSSALELFTDRSLQNDRITSHQTSMGPGAQRVYKETMIGLGAEEPTPISRDEKRFGFAGRSTDGLPQVDPATGSGLGEAGLNNWAGSQQSLSSQRTGLKAVQEKIEETESIKQQYEAELQVLRRQLEETQGRLSGTEGRLAFQAEQTNQVMEEWRSTKDDTEEQRRAEQKEKDERINTIIERLLSIEEDLRREQKDMKSAISHKEKIIEEQEKRIRDLDQANSNLQETLSKLSQGETKYKTTLYVNDYKGTCC